MDKMVKILIIVCIILVAGFRLATGMLMEKNSGMAAVQNNSEPVCAEYIGCYQFL